MQSFYSQCEIDESYNVKVIYSLIFNHKSQLETMN